MSRKQVLDTCSLFHPLFLRFCCLGYFRSNIPTFSSLFLAVFIFVRLNSKSHQALPIRFGTLFLCPIVLYTIPYQYQLFQLLLPMWLLGSSIFCYVWLNIQYWPGLCNQQLDLLRSHFAHNILYSSCRQYTTLSIICSNIPIMETVFLGLEFYIDQWLYSSSSCSLNNLLCCSFDWYNSILLRWMLFFKAVFTFFHVGFHSASITSSCNCIALSSNLNFTTTCSKVILHSFTIAFSSFSNSYPRCLYPSVSGIVHVAWHA